MNSEGFNFDGATPNRVNGAWEIWERDPNDDWQYEAGQLASRAADVVRNDPVMAALLNTKLIYTHGSKGLRFRSLVELDGDPETTSGPESDLRKQIENEIKRASAGRNLDATGMYTRREMVYALDELATVGGDGFLVRCFLPDRANAVTATCWRMLRRDRVSNPGGKANGPSLYEGFVVDPQTGAVLGIWVGPPKRLGLINAAKETDWTYVPWYDDAGMPCVCHRLGKRVPGSYRGISMYAPNLVMAKQIRKTIDAYVVGKRIQACHPIFISCEDPAAAAKADRNGAMWGPNTVLEPGKTYYVGIDAKVSFPSFSFQGADMQAFLDALNRNQTAPWGTPIDVVLAQLTNTNMAASRSAWLQLYRQADRWQDDDIEQVEIILDAQIIHEAVLHNRIRIPAGMDMHDLMRGDYIRPPRSMPDPLKEASAVEKWVAMNRDKTGLWAESGVDFRESITQSEEDGRYERAHGFLPAPVPGVAAPQVPAAPPEEDDPTNPPPEDPAP